MALTGSPSKHDAMIRMWMLMSLARQVVSACMALTDSPSKRDAMDLDEDLDVDVMGQQGAEAGWAA